MKTIVSKIKSHLAFQTYTARLMYALIAVFLITFIFQVFLSDVYVTIVHLFTLNNFNYKPFYIWRYITYMFIHADVIHLLLNLLMLYFFSILFTTFFSQKQLLAVFVAGGVFSGLFFEFLATLFGWNTVVVGASGAITALLITVASFRPSMEVRVPLIGYVRIVWIAVFFVVLDFLQLPLGNVGGHITHIGGALFGLLAGLYFKRDTLNLNKKATVKKNKNIKKVYSSSNKSAFDKVKQEDKTQMRIDDILDKISKSGYESLSKDDKEFLFRQK